MDVLVLVSLGVFWARGILVAQAGTEPTPPAVRVQSPNHWTTREVPSEWPFKFFIIPDCQPILMVRDGGQLLFH